MKKLLYLAVIVILVSCTGRSGSKQYEFVNERIENDSVDRADSIEALKRMIENGKCDLSLNNTNLDVLQNETINSENLNSVRTRLKDIQQFYSLSINDSILNDTLKVELMNFKSRLSKIQTLIYPKMRRVFASNAKDKLWEENIDVKYSGKSITFVGGIYASNKNIQESFDKLYSVLDELRFKKVTFRWYEYDDGYYYNISSYADSFVY